MSLKPAQLATMREKYPGFRDLDGAISRVRISEGRYREAKSNGTAFIPFPKEDIPMSDSKPDEAAFQATEENDETKVNGLPPDPDGENEDRSAWAGVAIAAFRKVTGSDEEDAVADLLSDMMHWCDRNNQSFETALVRARQYYIDETLADAEFPEVDEAPKVEEASILHIFTRTPRKN